MSDQTLFLEGFSYGLEIDLKESVAEKGLIKFRGKFQEANTINKNKRIYPYAVLDENVQRLQDIVKARGLLGELDHPCLTDPNFRVLTIDGWKLFKEIKSGDYVYSRLNGQMVKSKVNAIVDNFYDGPVYYVKGKDINCTFTPGHKFLLKNKHNEELYSTIKEIYDEREKYSHYSIPKTAEWSKKGSCINLNDLVINIDNYTGRIYCLTTDQGNFYMEYKGKSFWTGNSDSIVHFKEASHVITKLYWNDNVLKGEGEILTTAHGRQLKELLNNGIRIGMSSRGVGNGKTNENGILTISEGYKLITFDAVCDPSTHEAYQEKVVNKESFENLEKNNKVSVYINKDALIAAIGGIIREVTDTTIMEKK